jgi:hypothetical protein
LVATIDDKRGDAGAEGLADALDIATSRDNAQLQRQLRQVRLGAIALGGERFSVLQLQNLITAMLADRGDGADAAPWKRRAGSMQATHTGPESFQASMLQEIAANAHKAGDERCYLTLVLEQLVYGRVLDLEAIVAASRRGAVDGTLSAQAPSLPAQKPSSPGRAHSVKMANAAELRTFIQRALGADDGAALISLARGQGRNIDPSLPREVAEVFSLIQLLVDADRTEGTADQAAMLVAVEKHAREMPAALPYLRKVLEELANGRGVDADAIAAHMVSPATLRQKNEHAPLAKAPASTPDLYQVMLDSLGSAVRAKGSAVLAMEVDRLTATMTPRLAQWLRQVRGGSVVLGGDRFTLSQLKNLVRAQIEGGDAPQGGKAGASAFRMSMQQAIEQHAAVVADQHRYYKQVL